MSTRSRRQEDVSNFLVVKGPRRGSAAGWSHRAASTTAPKDRPARLGTSASRIEEYVCRCGNVGCLGAAVDGEALARRMRAKGHETANGRAVAALARGGNIDAIHEIRSCGRAIGEVVAGLVNFFNPEVVVVGGVLVDAHEQLLAGLKEVMYQRCLPLATRHLRLATSAAETTSIVGAATMTVDHVMSPDGGGRADERGRRIRGLDPAPSPARTRAQ